MEVTEKKVMASTAKVINFIKSQTKQDLVNANNSGLIELDQKNLEKICNIVEVCIQSNFAKSTAEITKIFKV